jgi:hypothetical protein
MSSSRRSSCRWLRLAAVGFCFFLTLSPSISVPFSLRSWNDTPLLCELEAGMAVSLVRVQRVRGV